MEGVKNNRNNIALASFFNEKAEQYNNVSFIKDDPISIPHRFIVKQDIEIAGFFAAILAWGNRKANINSCDRLLSLMNHKPYRFVMDLKVQKATTMFAVSSFVHRTFNGTDLLYLLDFLHYHFAVKEELSLETAFTKGFNTNDSDTENILNGFRQYVFSGEVYEDFPQRTKKHIAAPLNKSACKRLNMYLRWMVRSDDKGVDFGLWKTIKPLQLVCPLDVHVARVAKRFNILDRKQTDWQAAIELTNYLKHLDANDPVKYDFALFGLGVIEKYC
jgi:uncharacterized protein (TIGR02757 family)